MEDENYFTPDITEFRIGYECECLNKETVLWEPITIVKNNLMGGYNGETDILDIYMAGTLNNTVRVPYLTQQQIESEGWRLCSDGGVMDLNDNPMVLFDKSGMSLSYKCTDVRRELITIELHWGKGVLYKGQCRDINTLRYIQKLLNIKR